MKPDRAWVDRWSQKYLDGLGRDRELETSLFDEIGSAVRKRGCLLLDELKTIARWKAPRAQTYGTRNSPEDVQEISRLAFTTQDHLRARVLTLLDGVGIPMASAILTVWNPERYTVLDWRAVASLRCFGLIAGDAGARLPPYSDYLQVCRRERERLGISLRTLDRALWKWSQAGSPQ